MGASILWTPGKMRSFCGKSPQTHVHKIPRFRGGGYFGFWGGGSADFIFMGARISLKIWGVWGVRDISPLKLQRGSLIARGRVFTMHDENLKDPTVLETLRLVNHSPKGPCHTKNATDSKSLWQ